MAQQPETAAITPEGRAPEALEHEPGGRIPGTASAGVASLARNGVVPRPGAGSAGTAPPVEPLDEESPVDTDGAVATGTSPASGRDAEGAGQPVAQGSDAPVDAPAVGPPTPAAEGQASHDLGLPQPLRDLMARGWAAPS